jgi:hypothetical protein
LSNQAGKYFHMSSRRDFRDDAAERAMRVILADHRLRKDLPVASDQRGGAIVAGRFKEPG